MTTHIPTHEYVSSERVSGSLFRDSKGRPRHFTGKMGERYGMWSREYRKHISITVYEEIKRPYYMTDNVIDFIIKRAAINEGLKQDAKLLDLPIKWIDNNGINTPYLVTTVNNKGDK